MRYKYIYSTYLNELRKFRERNKKKTPVNQNKKKIWPDKQHSQSHRPEKLVCCSTISTTDYDKCMEI